MDGYDDTTYGRLWAPHYDQIYANVDDSMVDLLARHAGEPPRALELAIGSGRVAIPLTQRGVEVSGIDSSPEMVALMRAKPGGEAVPVTMGNFGEVDVDGTFPLIYLTFNTIFALRTQEEQVDCFRNVAGHLEPGGRFVIDCFVPDLRRYDAQNTRIGVSSIETIEQHMYEMTIYDPVTQSLSSHIVKRNEDGSTAVLPVQIRFAWPSELDLMARIAGLQLEDRFGWYDLRPFNERSTSHMSIYVKPR